MNKTDEKITHCDSEKFQILKFTEAPFEIIDGDRGKHYPKKTDFYKNGHCLFLNTKNVRLNGFDFDSKEFITINKDRILRKGKLRRGDIVLTTRGTIGNVGYYNNSVLFNHIRINSGMLIFRPDEDRLHGKYLFHFFQSQYFRKQCDAIVSGAAQPQLPIRSLNEVFIPLPKLNIQKKIVEVLSTWDQAIEKLDRFVLAKEKQFKWLLKKLIYDQKNNSEWKKIRLEKILNYEQPTNYIVHSTEYNDQYNTPVLTAGKTFIIGYTNEKHGIFPIQKLPVIIFDDFTTAKQFVDFPFKVKSSAMKILIPKQENVDIKFVFYSMQNIAFQVKSHKRFWISQYSKVQIPLPSLSEQRRITEILLRWEKEIEKLKQLSEKYHEQKKGLMQKLLTGK